MSAPHLADLGERGLVARLTARLAGQHADARVRVGIGDDAAVVSLRGHAVLTVDTQWEGNHFERTWLGPRELGRRALAVSVSDLAAMGARPVCVLCSLVLPADLEVPWLDALLDGMREGAQEFGCAVVGGDVTTGTRIGLCVTAVGELPTGCTAVLRSGARPGDRLLLAGRVGLAAAGRLALASGLQAELPLAVAAYRHPTPWIAFALTAAPQCHALMDVSDGLALDLTRLCEASGVGARLDAAALGDRDLDAASARLRADPMRLALGGGDDYALLLAVAPEQVEALSATARSLATPLRQIGGIVEGRCSVRLVGADGADVEVGGHGWDPFASLRA